MSALILHGEQVLGFIFALLLAIIAALVAISVAVIRLFRRRLWKGAYVAALVPWAATVVIGYVLVRRSEPSHGPPTLLAAAELPSLIAALPTYTSFGCSGLAFFKGRRECPLDRRK